MQLIVQHKTINWSTRLLWQVPFWSPPQLVSGQIIGVCPWIVWCRWWPDSICVTKHVKAKWHNSRHPFLGSPKVVWSSCEVDHRVECKSSSWGIQHHQTKDQTWSPKQLVSFPSNQSSSFVLCSRSLFFCLTQSLQCLASSSNGPKTTLDHLSQHQQSRLHFQNP